MGTGKPQAFKPLTAVKVAQTAQQKRCITGSRSVPNQVSLSADYNIQGNGMLGLCIRVDLVEKASRYRSLDGLMGVDTA